jgi:hypothetical protein
MSRMAADLNRDPDLEWLDHVRPVGLVVAPVLLKELGLSPSRQTQADSAVVAEQIGDDPTKPTLQDAWAFFEKVLGWEARHVAGSPGGPPLPDDLSISLPEQATVLSPTWAVKELDDGGQPWQLLVRIEPPGINPDARGSGEGWEATPHQRFERLLRETGVFAGLLISENNEIKDGEDRHSPELRLVYAPRGETSGHLKFPLRELRTVAGRPMLGGLKLLLDSFRLFADGFDRRLPALLKKSREAQVAVSTALAEQVLGALHDLLRGLDAAEPELIRDLARNRPGHLYEGLLTVLMRLVFILYAEDRDLLPSRTDGRARQIYETSYAVRGLYAKLTEDAALNPDTMDERYGGWGRLLALFKLIHKGHRSHFVQARGGKLFDPDQFPYLEGRADPANSPRVATISDGCILRILEGLMTLKSVAGRERLSYRALDVEQIGSVYETVMGFTVEPASGPSLAIKAGKNNHTPVFVDLEKLVAAKGKDRIKYLKEVADRAQLSANVAKAVEAAKTVADMAAALDAIVDERGSPRKHEAAAGMPLLQPTDERRRTGSHYTPRSLTEPIVRYALEPAFERLGPQATPERILDLKVCDPAMGSGAFLVEACRAIAAKLVEAWTRHPAKKPAIPPDEDEELHARRLVAQRCLYGVDKNPLATDLAKLSLWLATLARDHEFTFLDHALKSGDSLVGLTQAQIAAANWDMSKPGLPLFRQLVSDRVAEAVKGRTEIQAAPDDTARAIQEARHRSLEARLAPIRVMGDAVISAFFAESKPKQREKKRQEVESLFSAALTPDWARLEAIAKTLRYGRDPLAPFHWEIEFPEVFAGDNGGFDAMIGNPPFLGGVKISNLLGMPYFSFLTTAFIETGHLADYVAYFFRKAFSLCRTGGTTGLIATNTIAQGDTRESGLRWIIEHKGDIYRAIKRLRWPGEAAIVVSTVHILKGATYRHARELNGRKQHVITAFLLASGGSRTPYKLNDLDGRFSQGTNIRSPGFLFGDNEEPSSLNDLRELEASCPQCMSKIFPYLGGEEINASPGQQPKRYVINVNEFEEEDQLRQFSALHRIVKEKVKPERDQLNDNPNNRKLKRKWWCYHAERRSFYAKINRLRGVLVNSQVSPHLAFVMQPIGRIWGHTLNIFALDAMSAFSCMQSRPHELWARFFASSMKDDLRYTPSDCFETFTFPPGFESSSGLQSAGESYHDHRATLMVARNEGMTKTYNRFHDRSETSEDIQRLRELHAAMDRAVLEAYGWSDLAARATPIFLDETNEDDHTYQGRLFWPSDFRDEVLARLLALNAERHVEEVRLGIAPGMKKDWENEVEEH